MREQRKLCLIGWPKITAPKHEGGLGFRDPELVNISLVSKLVWRFLNEGGALWCQLLRAKYLRNKSFWDAHKLSGASHVWKGILDCRNELKSGCCWFVGADSVINVWNEPWVPLIPGFRVEGKPNTRHMVTHVKDLMLPNLQQWNIQLIDQIFDIYEAHAIRSINIGVSGEDKLMWLPMATGNFSAKSMYRHLALNQPSGSGMAMSNMQFNWAKLWNIRGISPRTVLFLWRALHGGIVVASVLGRFLHSNETCKVCNSATETIDHALIQCPQAKDVWTKSGIPLTHNLNQTSLKDFAWTLLMEGDQDQFRLALAILWILWKARNALVFSNKTSHTESLLKQAQIMFNDYKNPLSNSTSHETPEVLEDNHLYSSVHWLPPPPGFTKINVDGACLEGRMAAGAIARDHLGGFVGCAAKDLDYGSPILAEANVFLLGIQLIQDLNISNVIIEGDSKLVVDWINDPTSICDWRVLHAVQFCREFINHRRDISCRFSPRTSNIVAHALAHFSITYHVTNLWSEGLPPPPLLDLIFADLAFIVNSS